MKRKILIHSLVFSPDGVSTAYLYNDLALGFQEAGYEVIVLSTTPHYNLVEHELQKQPLCKRLFGLYSTSSFHGIKVYHVYQKKYKQFLLRVIGFLFWHFMSFVIGLRQRNVSFILSPSPPLTIGLISIVLAKLKGAKVAYNVQEIYPDFLINQGSLKSGFLIRILQSLERFVYQYSDAVITIDQLFYNTIKNRVKDRSKLHVIPNFVDTSLYKRTDSGTILDNALFPSTDSLKVMYAGNIGYAQDWEPLLFAAEALKEKPIEFFVIGEGVLKESIRGAIQQKSLHNIHLLPYQPRSFMPAIVSYADLHFIFMSPKMDEQGFPSKVYTIMACGKPLVVISGKDTPLYHFLKETGCAFLVESDNSIHTYQVLTQTFEKHLYDKYLLEEMGERGSAIIQQTYSKEVVVQQYISLVQNILA